LVWEWDTADLYIQGGATPRFVFALYDPARASYHSVVTSATTVAKATTYHVVGTYNGSKMQIYVNGVLQGATAHYGPVHYNPSLGGELAGDGWGPTPTAAFQGNLDDISIYKKALTAAEVRSHYVNGIVPGKVKSQTKPSK
jgi:hypothetical protein